MPPNKWPESSVKGKPRGKWTDLSFLDIACRINHIHGTYGIYEAQISFVICGSDYSRWTGYAFVDTGFNDYCRSSEDHADEEEDEDEEEEEDDDDGDDWGVLNEDPVAFDGVGQKVGVTEPMFNPRHYFLYIVDSRMKQVLQEWTYLVRTAENCVGRCRAEHPFTLSDSGSCGGPKDVRSAIDWTVQAVDLLCLLRGVLSKTLKAWERFDGSNGDINYFLDVGDIATIRLEGIRESFEELMDLDQNLSHLQESCRESKNILELRMSLEGNRLNLESNRLNFESHALNRRSHELTYQARLLHRDSHQVSLDTNRVALANHKTAQLGFWMTQILAPLAIVIAIFGMQQEIFHFNRNLRSFVFAVIASILLVWLIIFILDMAVRYSWLKRCSASFNRLLFKRIKDEGQLPHPG
ncbi:hypothetical protein K469DRAFT_713163 [Zopfia rhizophila CBS 207.26]|uniref:Uncharacterized protein n=1 Tax=Zopfia rhizophila CBS 207.26 TaxID=1314779 RepID=A0A6A6DV79_9PEZI|nr:hypothetical protein K469DRAFT_713163 [Zopfia rhizophila CBS 207.26]